MGPRSYERGIWASSSIITLLLRLQWGRVLTNAESSVGPNNRGGEVQLQWGRVLTNAESMEPAIIERTTDVLQWGRVLTNAESLLHISRSHSTVRFNGAAFLRTRNLVHCPLRH